MIQIKCTGLNILNPDRFVICLADGSCVAEPGQSINSIILSIFLAEKFANLFSRSIIHLKGLLPYTRDDFYILLNTLLIQAEE